MVDKGVLIDWDGTMADSIGSYIQLMAVAGKEYGFDLPDQDDVGAYKKILTKRSLPHHLQHEGVPEEEVQKVRRFHHSGEFHRTYPYDLFPGIKEMINTLQDKGIRPVILSYNHKNNILPVLAKNRLQPFIFGDIVDFEHLDRFHQGRKEGFIERYMGLYTLLPKDVHMVGDTHWDYSAAAETRTNFIGVNYGWGEFQRDDGITVVDTVQELEEVLSNL